ncbi:hypothetical protein LV79_001705 [Actinokineospora globicatena]|nr:hypothetical protein [Actinokineospora globicatena]GLW76309.1 hypothetical protein Aglo01_07910 [Actinokineospora globicatena]GLW83145.1 hypothetical protein Aglo02_07850 [Actinokineospora globicatena]
MSVWWAAVAVAVPTLASLIRRWMVLRFLRRVYEHGGVEAMKAAAESLRRTHSWTVAEKVARNGGAITRGRGPRDP